MVTPKEGIPYETEFVLSVAKNIVEMPLKCEFGYVNRFGKIKLPSTDTGDFLSQTSTLSAKLPFNNDLVSIKASFPPVSAVSKGFETL